MARISRIPHPPGATFFRLHAWVVRAAGRDAAVVLDAIDFLDQREELAGPPVVSRLKLLAHLEGVVGRNGVDKALKLLVENGWIKKKEKVHLNQNSRNINTFHLYSLHPEKISAFLENKSRHPECGTPEIPDQGPNLEQTPETDADPDMDPCSESNSGASKELEEEIDKETKKEAEEKNLSSTSAMRLIDQQPTATTKHSVFSVRDSGIATWNYEDEEKASRIEAAYAPDRILAAVTTLNKQNKLPLPGYVRMVLLQINADARREEAVERLSRFENKIVRIDGLDTLVQVRRTANGFYGELVNGKAGVPHSDLVDCDRRGLISIMPDAAHQLPAR